MLGGLLLGRRDLSNIAVAPVEYHLITGTPLRPFLEEKNTLRILLDNGMMALWSSHDAEVSYRPCILLIAATS